jgi:hypothetical protein
MNINELSERYKRSVRILRSERKMRERVFAKKPKELEAKVAEIDLVLEDLEAMKDALKAKLQHSQPALLDVPVRAY